jgi:16S rRNA C1402 (ribose-2'-O) methylase RsmI
VEALCLSVRNFFLSGFLEIDYFRKRKQLLDLDKSPSVHITYHHLTRESKKRLQEAVRQWAEWHGRHYITVGSSLDRERDREKPSFQDIEHACYL